MDHMTLVNVKDMNSGALNYATSMAIRGDRGGAWIYNEHALSGLWEPAVDWEQGGLLIEEYKISVHSKFDYWCASKYCLLTTYIGDTPLIAAMRCLVVLKGFKAMSVPNWLLK